MQVVSKTLIARSSLLIAITHGRLLGEGAISANNAIGATFASDESFVRDSVFIGETERDWAVLDVCRHAGCEQVSSPHE